MKDWRIEGEELANCNCNYGCPCQFGVLPTDGTCRAVAVYQIERGHYGDTRLDGLRAAGVYRWPGAIHEGDGEMQLIIDHRADDDQRAALEAIMTGQDTREMATMWFVFSAMAPRRHPTVYAPIELDLDREGRLGRASVGDMLELDARPIPNIVSGEPHRIAIQLPHGFEFRAAEMAAGSTRGNGGAVDLGTLTDSHAHFARLHLTGEGVVHA